MAQPRPPKDMDPQGHDLDPVMTNHEMLDLAGDGHDLHEVLTNSEVIAVRMEARAKIQLAKRDAAKKHLLELETERLKIEEGLVTGGAEDEMRTITIDLAPVHLDKLVINGREYFNGHSYTVPVHLCRSLMEIMFRGWQHEHSVSGKSLTDFYRQAQRNLKPAIIRGATGRIDNAPTRIG